MDYLCVSLFGHLKLRQQPERYAQFELERIDIYYFHDIIQLMIKGIKYIFLTISFLFFLSCNKEYVIVEMVEQQKGMISNLDYEIETIYNTINIKFKNFQKIYPKGEIIDIRFSSMSQKGHYDIETTSYYSLIEKRIVIYFYYFKYGIEIIDSLDKTFLVEPFENFKGYYTEHFVYHNNEYQIISINPNIKIEEFVEEFDYKKLKETGISQCKMLGTYIDKDKLLEEIYNRKFFSGYINYIFPEDHNVLYKNYSIP